MNVGTHATVLKGKIPNDCHRQNCSKRNMILESTNRYNQQDFLNTDNVDVGIICSFQLLILFKITKDKIELYKVLTLVLPGRIRWLVSYVLSTQALYKQQNCCIMINSKERREYSLVNNKMLLRKI